MTTFFNVTDAIGSASNHGITRTERKLGQGLSHHGDVEFVVMHRGRLWVVPKPAVADRLSDVDQRRTPIVERFGTADTTSSTSGAHDRSVVRAIVRRIRDRAPAVDALGGIDLAHVELGTDDVLISVGLDWVHGTLAEAERIVFGHGGRFLGLCYDTIPVDHPEWVRPPDPRGFAQYLERLARTASRVMCISHCTKRDFERHLPAYDPECVPVVRLGADAAVAAGEDELAWVDDMMRGEPYAIYCATIDRRKNHEVLYRAMRELVRRGVRGRLVFVGMVGSGVADLLDTMRHDHSIAGRITHITQCDDAHLAALYQRAHFAVYPSLYEGWGLGVTEALAHNKACIVASGSSLGEAGLGECPEVHPLRTGDWVELMASYFQQAPPPPTVELPTWASATADVMQCASS